MEQYKTLADYYGELIQDMDAIALWRDFTDKYSVGNHFLELACGRGDLANLLKNEGREIYATDLSDQMIENGKKLYPDIHFDVMDMRHINFDDKFDTILCFCDSFNYLDDYDDAETVIQTVKEHLNEGGVFLFDTHSLDRLDEFEEEWIEEGETEDGTGYQWSILTMDNRLYQHLAFYFPNDLKEETHVQFVFDPMILKEMLEKNGFDVMIKTDFNKDGIAEGEKYFFIAKKR